jgi:hypothetical protein
MTAREASEIWPVMDRIPCISSDHVMDGLMDGWIQGDSNTLRSFTNPTIH